MFKCRVTRKGLGVVADSRAVLNRARLFGVSLQDVLACEICNIKLHGASLCFDFRRIGFQTRLNADKNSYY